jgi:hypothetical protein
MDKSTGFFGALFDMSFTSLITTRIIKVLYVLAIVLIGIEAIAWIGAGFHQSTGLGVAVLFIIAPLVSLVALIYTRVLLEVVIALFRVMENTGELVARTPKLVAAPSAFTASEVPPVPPSGPPPGGAGAPSQ